MHRITGDAFAVLLTIALAGCARDTSPTGIAQRSAAAELSAGVMSADAPGAVYALTNEVGGNAVAAFARAADGSLTLAGSVATGGTGTGASLGSQGAIALSDDGRWLFAVNAGSNDVSAFRRGGDALSLTSRVASGGERPISLTVHGDLLYVLNAGGDGNISGFTIGSDGVLHPLANSARGLSSSAAGPAQVSFSPDGRWLVVSEKATSRLDTYAIGPDGLASPSVTTASAGATPFGFAFGLRGDLFVSEAAGSASSYRIGSSGALTVNSGAVPTHQGAPCWAVVTRNGKFGYTANAQGGSISGYRFAGDGSIALIDADGRTAVVGGGNIDLALSGNSRYLFQLNGNRSITGFRVEADGHLTAVGTVAGLPASTVGLAAR